MWKQVASGTLVALVASPLVPVDGRSTVPDFASARMYVEYDPAAREAVMVFEGESDAALVGVELRSQSGAGLMALRTRGRSGSGTSEFVMQSAKVELESLFTEYPEGLYFLRGRTLDGETQSGRADFSHALPAAPELLYPVQGAGDVPVHGLAVQWKSDPSIDRWRIVIEQDEKDGLTAYLPNSASTFTVPDGILAANRRTRVEVSSIAANGNRVQTEVVVRTQ